MEVYVVDYVNFGKAVAAHRKKNTLTQAQLGELCGLSDSYIGCLERGDRKPSMDTFLSLCYALEVSPNRLLYESLPDNAFGDILDTPLTLRQPDTTLRNTLTNWYFADLPDESILGEPPVTHEQLSRLQFTLLDEELPVLPFS